MKLSAESETILARANPRECTRNPEHPKPVARINLSLDTVDGPRRTLYLCSACLEMFVQLPSVEVLDVEYTQ